MAVCKQLEILGNVNLLSDIDEFIEANLNAGCKRLGTVEQNPVVDIAVLTCTVILRRMAVVDNKGIRLSGHGFPVQLKNGACFDEQHQITVIALRMIENKAAVMSAAAAHPVDLEHRTAPFQ